MFRLQPWEERFLGQGIRHIGFTRDTRWHTINVLTVINTFHLARRQAIVKREGRPDAPAGNPEMPEQAWRITVCHRDDFASLSDGFIELADECFLSLRSQGFYAERESTTLQVDPGSSCAIPLE